MLVRDVLERKGHDVKAVSPHEAIEIAAALMRLEQVGALVVRTPEGALAGLISERDVVQAIVDHGPRALKLPVSDYMAHRPPTCRPGDHLSLAAKVMTLHRARHLPVIEDSRVIGIVSVGDVVRDRIEEMELERDTLRDIALSHQAAG
ncbi:CBS domain-containing protein [Tranquillimonas alkanivorans]|uniref:CBS domain-containing protein n=1 Tax=Tranquillimonas alkanivorans TaxID=441119 RepID=A0A1I5RTD0_9RHOB|nr:CBS domain-containing protein [Tranquillimonas alkanivorans]SFP61640.1 CBS domain-containing protein [Tranquillimonas alkanivorans]